MDYAGREVAVVGLGRSNVPLVRFLVKKGARVTGFDMKTAEELGQTYHELASLGVRFSLGRGYLKPLPDFRHIFVTPGMRKDLPELQAAREKGARLSSETALFFELCPSPVIGITGSAGKTTTTTLVGEVLKADGQQVLVGGNIGNPLIEEVERIPPQVKVVLELSSFQLQLLRKSPWIGAVLNVSPNHLDIHASMEEYVEAKKNIYRYQKPGDRAVFGYDNPYTREMGEECGHRAVFFSAAERLQRGAYLEGGAVWLALDGRHEEICSVDEIKLLGRHNLENVLAAALIGGLAGVRRESLRQVITGFTGVAHRLELVRELGGVLYYNDSIATTPERTIAALRSFQAPIILMAGGYDKHLPFDELAKEVVSKVKMLITLGATAPKIEAAVKREMERQSRRIVLRRCDTLAEAVQEATQHAEAGDVVLLSPACASYDMFRNFEERGRAFSELVNSL